MHRNIFISFLGTNDYLETYYQFNDETLSQPVRFIQEALISKYCRDWTEDDHIYVFYTNGADGSFIKNWKDGGQPKSPNAIGLEKRLQDLCLKAPVEGVPIPEGFSIDEIWKIFGSVYDKLQEGDSIYFDVTHAFRSIPMFSIVLFNYAQFMLNTQIKAINYGAFEKLGPAYKVKDMPLEQRIAPVIDLMPLVELQQITDIASSLVSFGRLNKLGDTLSDKNNDETSAVIKQIKNGIEEFDTDLLANRMNHIKSGRSITQIRNSVRAACISQDISLPVKRVIQRLDKELAGFVPTSSYQNVEAAIDWAVKYKMLPQAYTLGQEYIISLVADYYAERNPYNSGKKKEDTKNFRSFISSLCSISDKHVTERNYKGELSRYSDLADELLATDKVSNLRKPFAILGSNRNAVNHAKGEISYGRLAEEFNQVYGRCLEICSSESKEPDRIEEKTAVFINLTNHPSDLWEATQKTVAEEFGAIIDMPFPSVDPNADEQKIALLADEYFDKISGLQKDHIVTVHLMGEFTFCTALLNRLHSAGIRVVASCTERVVSESGGVKTSQFKFVKFRTYE